MPNRSPGALCGSDCSQTLRLGEAPIFAQCGTFETGTLNLKHRRQRVSRFIVLQPLERTFPSALFLRAMRFFELPYIGFNRRYNKNNGSTARGSRSVALKEGLDTFFCKMVRIRRCNPNGIARRASHRFSVEYVTQRKRANSSWEKPIAFLIFRILPAVIFALVFRGISVQAPLEEGLPYSGPNSL